jgi:hypothetical protein
MVSFADLRSENKNVQRQAICENLATSNFKMVQRGCKFRMSENCIVVRSESYCMRADMTVFGVDKTSYQRNVILVLRLRLQSIRLILSLSTAAVTGCLGGCGLPMR